MSADNVTTLPARPKSVTLDMADKYNMEPAAFEAVVRDTCMPPDRNGSVATREEFAAFLMVCREHNLNPITREIYAIKRKGGAGLIPVVSVDGWIRKINEHPLLDGLEFEEKHDDKGKLFSTTCRIWRKDRSRPTEVTEYLAECARDTEPWRMPHRMLRHKALIQCARVAFGFAGIYDEDEAERFAAHAAKDVTPKLPPKPPAEEQKAIPDGVKVTTPKKPPIPGRSSEAYAEPPKPETTAEDASFVDLVDGGADPERQLVEDYDAELGAAETTEEFDQIVAAYAPKLNQLRDEMKLLAAEIHDKHANGRA